MSRSKHEEIDLVSVDEFYKEAPPEISRTPLTKDDPHQLTLARLDWELEQRKRYHIHCCSSVGWLSST